MPASNDPVRFAPRGDGHAPHAVRLCGLRGSGDPVTRAPLLIERRDDDFIAGLYDDLLDDTRRGTLAGQQPRRSTPRGYNGSLPRLHPPVQRVFNIALFEALCDQPGQPRLDPRKIDSSGMVLRRVLAAPRNGARYEAWLKSGTKVHGWDAIDPAHEDDDPAADRRHAAVSIGNAVLNQRLPSNLKLRSALSQRLAGQAQPVHEHVLPAFVAPPDVCAATARTVLLGVVQVASNEQSEQPPQAPGYGRDADERQQLQRHLVDYLKDGGPLPFPSAGGHYDSAWALKAGSDPARRAEFEALDALTTTLRQLGVEFDAFGSSNAAKDLRRALNRLTVEYDEALPGGKTRTRREGAADFYQRAYDVLLLAEPNASFTMPHRSSHVDRTLADPLLDAVCAALDQQYKRLKPAKGRFEADSRNVEARYVVRAFVRLKPEQPGCAAPLLWSPYSEAFTIAPWYESAGQPPALVEMPDLFDRVVLKALKPNVAFAVPPKLAKLLEGDPKKLRDGEGDPGDGLGLAWICSFSIPIITICAFIVLMIFLTLLNLIFWWLPFLKVCIPFPKSLPPPQ